MRQLCIPATPEDPVQFKFSNDVQLKANRLARKYGHSRATQIKLIDEGEDRVISTARRGYRKFTTGEYVSNAYRNNFGWKNTYYQPAECVVAINAQRLYE